MKRTLIYALVVGLLSLVLATWIAPNALTWWATPPVLAGAPANLSCAPTIEWGMKRLIEAQLLGLGGGVLLGLVLAFVTRKKGPKAAPAAQLPAAAPGSPAVTSGSAVSQPVERR